MATTENLFTGDGSTTNYPFTFEYIDRSDVKADVAGVTTTDFTFANATTLSFDTAPDAGAEVRIYRDTDLDTLKATFFAGSAIKAEDLNNNFTQNNFAVQEVKNNTWDSDLQTIKSNETWVSNDDQIATTAAMDARFQDEVNDTLTKAELAALSDVIPDDDVAVPTTGAVKDYVDHVIETDILVDGTGLNKTSSNGQVTIGISANSVDFDRIKNDDIITQAEQDAGSPSPADSNIFTASAAARRFDTILQTSTPSGSDWEVGKTWLQNDDDKTLYMWNGTSWLPVVSGGTFTELSKVIYVDSINGDDTLTGHRISNPKKTIKAAVDDINADSNGDGSVVVVAPGIYGETFPIDIEKNDIAIVGTSLRNCIIHPAIPAADQAGYDVTVPEANELTTMFRVNSGSYFYGLTLTGMKASGARGGNSLDTDATYGLPTNQGWNFAFYPNAQIKKSPYIQNCTNFSDSKVNNVNFTPHTPGEGSAGDLTSSPTGGGILVNGATVASNSPLRSMVADSYTHTALDGPGVFVTNNGYTQITSSYAFFNHYHIKCLNGGQANLAASTTDFGRYGLLVDGRSTSAIFTATTTATASDGDVTFTIGEPTADASWHGSATRPQGNMLVDIGGNTYPILSATANGSGWDVTISRPNPNKRDENLGLDGAVSSGAAVSFYLRSMIASSGHTMEYVGSGTDYTALPENGGVPIEANQVVELNNGKVWTATTDHNGKFKVGDFFTVDQRTGFVTVPVGSISFPVLAENLDVNGHNIFDSTGSVTIDGTLDVDGNKIVNVTDPTLAQDAATKNYVDSTFVELTGDTMTGALALPSGTADAPSLSVGTTDNGLYSPDTDQVAISTNGTGRLFVASDGKVGIGNSNPSEELEITSATPALKFSDTDEADSYGTVSMANSVMYLQANGAATDGQLIYRSGNDGTFSERLRITSGGQLSHIGGGTSGSPAVGFNGSAPANSLVVDSTGKVGLGTSSPGSLLEVRNDNSTAYDATDDGAQRANTATILVKNDDGTTGAFSQLVFDTAGNSQSIARIAAIRTGTSTNDLAFVVEGSNTKREALRITGAGNVGIGTASPASIFHLNKLSGDTSAIVQSGSVVGRLLTNDTGTYVGTTTDHKFTIQTNSTAKVTVLNTGNVGIGSNLPNQLLHINSSAASGGQLQITNASTGTASTDGLLIGYDGSNDVLINNQEATALKVNVNGSEALRVDSSGRLLVGTPSDTLPSTLVLQGRSDNTNLESVFRLCRGGTPTDNQALGTIVFADNGHTNAAHIIAFRDGGTWTSGSSQPTRLVFSTTADGASSPTARMKIDSKGRIGFPLTNTDSFFALNGTSPTVGTSSYINRQYVQIPATVSANVFGFHSSSNVASGTNLNNYYHFTAIQGATAGSTINKQFGFVAGSALIAGNSNYGFYSDIASGTGRWNFYASGTASNYFAGDTSIANVSVNPVNANVNGIAFRTAGNLISNIKAVDSPSLFRRNNDGDLIRFFHNNTTDVGSISVTTSATAYNTSSDYRLKENVVPLTGAADRLNQLQVRRFNFIADPDTTVDGFLAHEAQAVVPESVTGTKDAMEDIGTLTEWDGTVIETDVTEPESLTWEETITDEDGNETVETRTRTWVKTGDRPVMQGIDQSKLVPLLTAALQEALAEIESLKARVTALEP